MQSFVLESQTPTPTPEKKLVEEDSSSESTEEDINVLLKGLEEVDFNHPCVHKKVLERAFKIWSNAQPTQTRAAKRKRSKLPTVGPKGEAAIKQAQQEILQAYREPMTETTSSRKKPKIVCFDISKPSVTNMEEPEFIEDSSNVSPTTVEEEEPSTPPSPSKTPSVSPTSSPPKSQSVSLTQTPPPSLTKEPNPLMEIEPEKSPTKKIPSPKEPTTTEKPTDNQNTSTKKTTTKEKTPLTSTPSTKSKKPNKNKFKFKEIVKLDFVLTDQLIELSIVVNQ